MAEQYKTYEDLVGEERTDGSGERVDFTHGSMFNLPEFIKWWAAKEVWGKPKEKDLKERSVDVRFVGFVMEAPEFWPERQRSRMGGLGFTFPFYHHRDPSGARHLCLEGVNKGPCPRCDKFQEMREQTRDMKDQTRAWKELIAPWKRKVSGLMFGYVDGGDQLYAFEFTDTEPGKGFTKDPTIFDRITSQCREATPDGKLIPRSQKIDKLFYEYGPRAQILRLSYKWVDPGQNKAHWQLDTLAPMREEDGAPSTAVDPSVATMIKPWAWMDIEGERARMTADSGEARKAPAKPDFDAMTFGELMQYAIDNNMSGVLDAGYEEDEIHVLKARVKKEAK